MAKKRNTQRSDGRYAVSVFVGTVDGKRKYKYVYGKTQKEADLKADELRLSMRKGVDVTASGDTFDEWAEHWLASKKFEVSVDQYNLLKTRTQLWKNALCGLPMNKIKSFQVQTVLFNIASENPYTGKPMAKNTIKSYSQIVKAIFDFAIDNRVIEFNPTRQLKIPSNAVSGKARRALTETERQWVMEFEHRAKPSAMLMMLSGLRRGEATALQWSDIDFENNAIYVSKSYNFKQKEIKLPKNNKTRIVYVPQVLIDYLQTLPRKSLYVLTSANGKMMTADSWKRLYESYMNDLNLTYGLNGNIKKFSPKSKTMIITPFSPHELRHTFCTLLFESGVDVLTAQEQMGHSDPKITMEIYTHLSKQHKDRQINKLDSYLKECKSGASQTNATPPENS